MECNSRQFLIETTQGVDNGELFRRLAQWCGWIASLFPPRYRLFPDSSDGWNRRSHRHGHGFDRRRGSERYRYGYQRRYRPSSHINHQFRRSYKFNLLPPGNYKVKFEAAGFSSVEVPSANVNVTETEVLNRSLQVGAQTQEVTVQADVETVQTATSALGTVVAAQTVTELPLNTRNYTNLLSMSAGANSSVNNASTIGKGSSFIAVNGGGTAQNTYLQDGVTINNWYSFNTGTEGVAFGSFAIPNPDAIAEFKIQTSTYDAGYGRGPGANVNVITKTGTNQIHGTAFEFFRNTVLNANDWFYEYSELTHNQANKQPVLNSNVYGGAFGGAAKKDKAFLLRVVSGKRSEKRSLGIRTVERELASDSRSCESRNVHHAKLDVVGTMRCGHHGVCNSTGIEF